VINDGGLLVTGSLIANSGITGSLMATNGVVSSSQQITNYYKFAETASANTFYGNQSVSGNVEVRSAGKLEVFRSDNTRSGSFYCNNLATILEASTDPMRISSPERVEIYTAGVERIRVLNDGGISATGAITASNFRISTAGGGIDFSATSNGAGTTSSEILSDYEEGTWTPTYIGTNLSGVVYGNQFGWYTKVGRLVTVTICLMTTDIVVIGSENLRIGGLPFTSNSETQAVNALVIGDSSRWATNPPKYGVLNGNSTEIILYRDSGATGAGTDPVSVKTDDMADATGNRNMVRGTLTYFV
jgi:hypothetical protein